MKTDQLQCKVCDGLFHHKSLPGTSSAETRQADAARASGQLVAAHASDCPWKVTHSPESFCQLQPAPGAALLKHAETAAATFAPLAAGATGALFELDPLFHEELSSCLKELTSIARAVKSLPALSCVTRQLQALATAPAGDTQAALQIAITQVQPLLLAATGWAVVQVSSSGSAKRSREESSGSACSLICATCQASVSLKRTSNNTDSSARGDKQPRNDHSANPGSMSFRAAALRAVQASDAASAAAGGGGGQSTSGGGNILHSTPGKGTASTAASPQTSPLSSSLVREFSPPGAAPAGGGGSAAPLGMLHPLLAHRSSCPWVTQQSMQRHRGGGAASSTTACSAPEQRTVSQLGEAALRAVETVAALSAGGAVPTADGKPLQVHTVCKPGWQLYIDALCDSLLE